MANQLNTSVTEVVDKLLKANRAGKDLLDNVYLDETWNLQVALTNGNGIYGALSFRATYKYKNGKVGQNIIQMNSRGTVESESNPEVKIRKDLLEKMESVARGFYTETSKSRQKEFSSLGLPAIYRHYEELGDEIGTLDVREQLALGQNFVTTDINSGILDINTKNIDSNNFVFERRINDVYLRMIEETLTKMGEHGLEVDAETQNKLVQDIIDAQLDAQKTLTVIVKNLKYMIDKSMAANGIVDPSLLKTSLKDKCYGFVIFNKSNRPVEYNKLSYKTGEKIGTGIMQPADSVALSKAEAAMLLSRPTINGVISNAVLGQTSRKNITSKIAWRNQAILLHESEDKKDIRNKDIMTLPANQWERFMDTESLMERTDKILKLVFPSTESSEYNFISICIHILNEICKRQGINGDKAIGDTLSNHLRIDGKPVKVVIRPNANGGKDIHIDPKKKAKKKSLFSMFSR